MNSKDQFDVMVIGAGPAGTSCASRLAVLGYRVCIIERKQFPRQQIGESLSPGVQNIFAFLNANEVLEQALIFRQLSTNVIWETSSAKSINSHSNFIVDRSVLDKLMLERCMKQSVTSYCPADLIKLNRIDDKWHAIIKSADEIVNISASIVLDCKGRTGTRNEDRISTGPTSVGLCTHVPQRLFPLETNVEALDDCWIWGSPVSDGRYRIMVFVDPLLTSLHEKQLVLETRILKSQLFKAGSGNFDSRSVQSFSVQTYAHRSPWNDMYFRLGESAFTLDPLSSTGVEKAMRLSLRMAVVINTIFKTSNEFIGREYFLNEIVQDVSSHQRMANEFYTNTWCFDQSGFWGKRIFNEGIDELRKNLFGSVSRDSKTQTRKTPHEATPIDVNLLLGSLWHKRTFKSSDVKFIDATCIENNILVKNRAVRHPNLGSDVAYINDVNIVKWLDQIPCEGMPLFRIIEEWKQSAPQEVVIKIACHFIERRVLEIP